ncbi:class I SAM-dependent methyltransferase [Pseudoroseicyclus tamaricis]|uniref:Class I SAM-dependent methyltransferase n=1 Tax=Pseudoroseicyclus tamaricis TaxID=2705421 RepID=A0A6B2JUJ3_9RHOB|nr:SAM-dependent methyltransferase [Pseudoroseicyclus tamaricis]NDV01988.1 class I SAM-dependent methyltransferase [Pseudoroseicyclus tamaricis]
MTELAEILAARIRAAGPMSVAEYMGECLFHPEHGYYSTRPGIGSRDFTTAPEISQMFGEMLGLCLAAAWMAEGRPERFVLAELGPGRGVLMEDVLRATRGVPGFAQAAELHLVEASPVLRAEQARRLPAATHHERVEDLPEGPLYLLANEFFDALPIRQFIRVGRGWAERVVGLKEGALSFGLTEPAPVAALAGRLNDTAESDLVEICPMAPAIASEVGRRIAAHGGAALIVDYGGWLSRGDTLQALEQGAFADPLAEPGRADLTAHVDFQPLARAAAPALATALEGQGAFLERLGITERARALAVKGDAEAIAAAHRRLCHPDEMGTLFKVLGLYRNGSAPPPGLAEP